MAYDIGDLVRVSVYITVNGEATDPGTGPVCKYKDPSDVITTKTYPGDPEVVKDDVGRYHLDIDIDAAGTWYYQWSGTGSAVGAEEDSFEVATSEF